jgi:hypothetical protein
MASARRLGFMIEMITGIRDPALFAMAHSIDGPTRLRATIYRIRYQPLPLRTRRDTSHGMTTAAKENAPGISIRRDED